MAAIAIASTLERPPCATQIALSVMLQSTANHASEHEESLLDVAFRRTPTSRNLVEEWSIGDMMAAC
jgi:hypothetical protein